MDKKYSLEEVRKIIRIDRGWIESRNLITQFQGKKLPYKLYEKLVETKEGMEKYPDIFGNEEQGPYCYCNIFVSVFRKNIEEPVKEDLPI